MRSRIPAEEKAKELRDINLRIRRTREKQREALQ